MPTPMGHSLMGYILYSYLPVSVNADANFSWKEMLVFILLANFPDIDYLPGFFFGNPNKFHHGMTHSIGFALLVGAFCAFIFYLRSKQNFRKYFLIFTLAYFSHVLMDFFGKDTRFPFGEQLFWPLSEAYVLSPVAIFQDVHKASASNIFLQSLFTWHNLKTILIECIVMTPMLLFVKFKRRKEIKHE